jgi:hypothetical protein
MFRERNDFIRPPRQPSVMDRLHRLTNAAHIMNAGEVALHEYRATTAPEFSSFFVDRLQPFRSYLASGYRSVSRFIL